VFRIRDPVDLRTTLHTDPVMHCQNCGAELSADATRCRECGSAVETVGRESRGGDRGDRGGQPEQVGANGRRDQQPQPGQQQGNRSQPGQQQGNRSQSGQQQGNRSQPGRGQGQQSQPGRQQGGGVETEHVQGRSGRAGGQSRQTVDDRGRGRDQGRGAGGEFPDAHESGGSSIGGVIDSWGVTRLAAVGGGLVAGFTVTMPWVQSKVGGVDADAMSTIFGPAVALAAVVAIIAALANWGRGWGWLSMVLTTLSGAAIAGTALFAQSILSEDDMVSTVEVDGTDIPLAAVEPGGGVEMAMLAGGVVALASLAGIVGAIISR